MTKSTTSNATVQIKSKEIGSIESYVEEVGGTFRYLVEMGREVLLFRGQDKRRALLPGVARSNPEHDTTATERDVLEQLELLGASFPELNSGTSLDKLVVAQHFGLKTRLLDWTSNPLAALHFACMSRNPGDVYVYVLDAASLLEKDVYKNDPFSAEKTVVFQPRLNNPRIVAQHGWFTLHRYSQKSKRFVALEKNPKIAEHLREIVIPEALRHAMLTSLDWMGVNSRTLYPDLQGFTAYINWKHNLDKA